MSNSERIQEQISSQQWIKIILLLSLTLGLFIRFFPAWMAGFPINDGGMFLVMIRDLRSGHFILPAFTSYNNLAIPYAYPPLGFYLAGILSALGLSEVEVLRWLPLLINLTSVLAVYLLASTLLDDQAMGALGAGLYALIPGGYGWFIMGGGLTRALGGLFLVLSVYYLLLVLKGARWLHVGLTILFCSFAVLSHPEAAIHTAGSCALVLVFYCRSWRGLLQSGAIAVGTALLSSPWWLGVLFSHGVDPFLSVLHSGMYGVSPFQGLFRDMFSRGSLIPIVFILRIAGITWSIWKKHYYLVAWIALPYFVEPRSAPAVSFYPFVIMSAYALADAFYTGIQWIDDRRTNPIRAKTSTEMASRKANDFPHEQKAATTTQSEFVQDQVRATPARNWFEVRWMNLTILTIFFYLFFESILYSFPLINTSLKPEAIQAMLWISSNTPSKSSFLILRGESGAMVDPVQEWFPALALRRSNTTLQGLEWTLGEKFSPRIGELYDLQACQNTACIEEWTHTTGLVFTHLYADKTRIPQALLASLLADPDYSVIYENSAVIVFTSTG